MSELINNKEYRQKKLKEIILKLHDGAAVEDVKAEFEKLTINVSASEITEMEQALVDEGMPVEEIQRLCDVHSSVFKGSIEEIHASEAQRTPDNEAGHPAHTLKRENRAIEELMDGELSEALAKHSKEASSTNRAILIEALKKLQTIEVHYRRKENLIFPYMEKHNITAPPKVMWGVDDEIREKIKNVIVKLESGEKSSDAIRESIEEAVTQVREMIFKEENIMLPMIEEVFTASEWMDIEKESYGIGFTLIEGVERWSPDIKEDTYTEFKKEVGVSETPNYVAKDSQSKVAFDAGMLTAEEINSILNTVPIDMTFVGADNRVKYFTQGKERIFERPLTIIGREVKNCHPPKSVHIVEKIVGDLRTGKKEHEDFWIRMGEAFVYIRYYAVRSKQGEFLGVLEVSQDIKPITELEGEKRLMS
jgi:DUF438 domain-containing protein